MKQIEIKRGQTLFDVSIEHHGTVEAVINIAMENNLSITAEPQEKTIITSTNTTAISRTAVANYFLFNKQHPATSYNNYETPRVFDFSYDITFY
jgi:uncharacterized ubiquitin-like protein YukD